MISLAESARQLTITLTLKQLDTFDLYYRELIDWNARTNLTAITEHDQVVVKHFLDSLSATTVIRQFDATARIIDIGAGAGFPGVPLKIVLPELRLTLLETTGKKVAFLNHLVAQLHLREVSAIQARAEDLGHDPDHRERYDLAVARAVSNLATLLEYALPLLGQNGVFIAYKGVEVQDEIDRAAHALSVLGGRVREIVPVQLPGLEPRHLIVVEKTAPAPQAYPRRAGVPERKPL